MKILPQLIFVFLFVLLSACEKDSSKPDDKQLIARSWKAAQVLTDGAPDDKGNYSVYRWEFKSEETYTFTTPAGKQSGTWELINNNKILLLDAGTAAEKEGIITQLTESSFEWTTTVQSYKKSTVQLTLKLIPSE